MWLFLGISAIIFTGFNLICSFKSKNEKWFRFGAISFTALTVCSFYSDGAMRVLNEGQKTIPPARISHSAPWRFHKNEKWFRSAALSFTALTVCSFHSDGAMRVLNEDWGGLMDIMPTMSKALWVCVGISILLNSVSLFREK